MQKQKNLAYFQTLNLIRHWDFSPEKFRDRTSEKPGIFIINSITLKIINYKIYVLIVEIIEGIDGRGIDLLENNSYPIFRSNDMMFIGNKIVAEELVKRELAVYVNEPIIYPLYSC